MANNVITVGSESRSKILASLLDDPADEAVSRGNCDTPTAPARSLTQRSKRGFVTHTGTYKGVPVSIVMINMGYPNMDFLVREVRAVTEGPLRIVRLGSCAGLRKDLPVGTVAVASEGSIFVSQNPDAWGSPSTGGGADKEPYVFCGVAPADEALSRGLNRELKIMLEEANGGGGRVVGCLNVSADSFYSSQGGYYCSARPRRAIICVKGPHVARGY